MGSTSEHVYARMRRLEVERLAHHLPPGGRVIEIGGGNGWQAKLLTERGFHVVSVDLPDRDWQATHHEVVEYDGTRLPFADGSAEAIWSSNVLEHVEDLPALSEEMARVLAPGGVAVHVMPTPTWRVVSTLGYPLHLAQMLGRKALSRGDGAEQQDAKPTSRPSYASALRNVFRPGPHGAAPSAWAELSLWKRDAWVERLTGNGWQVRSDEPLGQFYTGNAIAPSLPSAARVGLARLLGSATRAYILTAD